MARTKTNTRNDTKTLTTSWRNRHWDKLYVCVFFGFLFFYFLFIDNFLNEFSKKCWVTALVLNSRDPCSNPKPCHSTVSKVQNKKSRYPSSNSRLYFHVNYTHATLSINRSKCSEGKKLKVYCKQMTSTLLPDI